MQRAENEGRYGRGANNLSQQEKNRIKNVRNISQRYIDNAQRKLNLSNQNRASSAFIGRQQAQYGDGFGDSSRFGDAQVSRRAYMGLSNG